MFRKLLTGLVAAAGLTFAGAAFAVPAPAAAPVATRTAAKPALKTAKLSRLKTQKKVAAKTTVKPTLGKVQPRKVGSKVIRANKKIARPNVKPAVLMKK